MCGVKVDLNYMPSLTIADRASVTKVPGTSKCKLETSDDSEYRECLEDAKFKCDMYSQEGVDYLNERTGCKITREDWLWKLKEYECAGTPTARPATYCANMKCYAKNYLTPLGVAVFLGGECNTSVPPVNTSVHLVGSLAVVVIAIFAVAF